MERKRIVRGMIFSLLMNGALPLLVYEILLGYMTNVMALTVATLIPLLETLIHFLRHRKWDIFALFMLIGFTLSILAALIGGDEKLILIRESFVTGVMGLLFLGSLFTSKPLIYHFALRFTVGKTQEEQNSFAENWKFPYVRKVLRIMTAGWGIALVGEALLKVVLVYSLSIPQFLAISSFISYGIIGLTIFWTAVYRRKSRERLSQLRAEKGVCQS